MNKQWTFLTETPWLWLLPLACLAIFTFCLFAELKKGRGAKKWPRVSLLLLAHIALLLAGLRPAYIKSLAPGKAILLQANARPEALDSLRALHPEAAVYSLRHEAAGAEAAIPHTVYLQQRLPVGSTLWLLGNGLEKDELEYLQAYDLQFIPAGIPAGLRGLSYKHDLQLGDTLKVSSSGFFEQDSLWLRLSLAGKGEDSLLVTEDKPASFVLQAQPTLAGVLEYRLDLLNTSQDTLRHYPLLVHVRPNKPVKLALLTAYPSFEARYLKNWLAKEGHSLYYQAEMAPGRFTREWLNMSESKPYALNHELLRTVDIIIMDQAFWDKLSPGRIRELREAVQQQGLGCLVLGAGGLWKPSEAGWATLPDLQVSTRTQAAPFSQDKQHEGILSSYLVNPGGWLPLLSNADRDPLLLFRPQGQGRIGFSVLESTYPLLLRDQDATYRRLWTNILNRFIRTGARPGAIEADIPALVGSRNHLRIWQEGEEMQEVVLTEPNQQKQVLPLVQDRYIPTLWHAYFWPRQSGEHSLNIQEGDSLSYIIYQAGTLPALQDFHSARETYSFIGSNKNQLAGEAEITAEKNMDRHLVAVSPLWFYGLFLLSMAGLWIERKLGGQ